jgi:hypothetical protein
MLSAPYCDSYDTHLKYVQWFTLIFKTPLLPLPSAGITAPAAGAATAVAGFGMPC